MPEYRAYAVGDNGHVNGYKPLVCANDEEAITKARILAQRHEVELWSGPRLVSSSRGSRPEPSPLRYTKAAWFRNAQRNRDRFD
ncbi:MAG: hypothetical protein QOD95_998 [Gammaproteobacteria bacterium]|nr:hypothetical protein [Gammaproteobacteria bacterium]